MENEIAGASGLYQLEAPRSAGRAWNEINVGSSKQSILEKGGMILLTWQKNLEILVQKGLERLRALKNEYVTTIIGKDVGSNVLASYGIDRERFSIQTISSIVVWSVGFNHSETEIQGFEVKVKSVTVYISLVPKKKNGSDKPYTDCIKSGKDGFSIEPKFLFERNEAGKQRLRPSFMFMDFKKKTILIS